MAAPAWRAMHAGDLPDVERISAIVHPRYPERDEVPAERLRLFPAGCLIATYNTMTVGYAIAHPGKIGQPPPLDTLLGTLPPDADASISTTSRCCLRHVVFVSERLLSQRCSTSRASTDWRV